MASAVVNAGRRDAALVANGVDALESRRNRVGIALESRWNRVGIALESRVGIMLESNWNRVRSATTSDQRVCILIENCV